ncbi:glycoside hydrolase family 3 C-terminal domain-containing protein [Streptomyces fuscichromogenes]|uniref:Exo-alpha-(1->6)-L-arabinopyranosidase n=1 Tax=Streptomyces fuscichromogenes TaxID=1324013 RepID=A0A917X9Y1_9ACTN|nr:glycoside hydrolase family 3 C-terminal domain-containing protein [Streptomyces fuscichromogenes]GGM98599.1 glycosyl hydrolase [Streptomyces fuscichromogenes]
MQAHTDLSATIAALTLQEKASLLSGHGGWETAAIEHAAVASVLLTDGPHGVRRIRPEAREFSFEASLPATCFPTAAALGSSWDEELLFRVGEALGDESRAAGVGVLLGPGMNIKRSPLCGRNFEYLSEDPALTGRLAAALVRGIQSRGVGASLKHFAANNQETDRMRVSAEVDERTLREIYLAGFEYAVKNAQPWTVMAAYNRINGVHAAENPWLLTEVLRGEWGFDGLVVSDWGAVVDPLAAVSAGLDLQMPGSNDATTARLVHAVEQGELEEAVLDRAVGRVLRLAQRVAAGEDRPDADLEAHHMLARTAAVESAVLLKNEGAILPLAPGATMTLAVIGEFARTPRFQGAGSSKVNAARVDNALDALGAVAGDDVKMTFSPGFSLTGQEDEDAVLLSVAVSDARAADVAVLFLGLPEGEESEGFDRADIDLPQSQVRVLEAVAEVNPNVVVVLCNGGVLRTSTWDGHARAVLEVWLSGQAGGGAVADLLFGEANPGGRLAETIPVRIQDTPAYLDFPGSDSSVSYGERLYVGYRHYDARETEVGYPFGHGLSYTSFAYSGLRASVAGEGADTAVLVEVTVTNTGSRAGKEVVQVYVGDQEASVDRPVRELKAFAKVLLQPGESVPVRFTLHARDFSFYSPHLRQWVLESGDFDLSVGASSRDLRLTTVVSLAAPALSAPLTGDSTVGEWVGHPVGGPLFRKALSETRTSMASDPTILRMVESLPLNRLVLMTGGVLPTDLVDRLLGQVADGTSS